MKKIIVFMALLGVLAGITARAVQVDLGISIADGRLRSFYVAVADHYRVAPRVVVDLRTRNRLLDEELPVVFFLAARAGVGPQAVIDLRLAKLSWLEIAFRLRLTPDIFFLAVAPERVGPPYGNAYGYYRKFGPSHDWRKIVLADREVIDLVNLRFMSEVHGLAPDAVIALRGRNKNFVFIHDELGKGKSAGPRPGKALKAASQGKGKKRK